MFYQPLNTIFFLEPMLISLIWITKTSQRDTYTKTKHLVLVFQFRNSLLISETHYKLILTWHKMSPQIKKKFAPLRETHLSLLAQPHNFGANRKTTSQENRNILAICKLPKKKNQQKFQQFQTITQILNKGIMIPLKLESQTIECRKTNQDVKAQLVPL